MGDGVHERIETYVLCDDESEIKRRKGRERKNKRRARGDRRVTSQ